MGVCTSSNKKKKRDIVKANKNNSIKGDIKYKKDNRYNNGINITSRNSNVKSLEKILGEISENELKRNNTNQTNVDIDLDSNKNKNIQKLNNSNILQNLKAFESMNTEHIPLSSIKAKQNSKEEKNIYNKKTEFSEKKSEKDNSNFNFNNIKSKEDNNTFSTLKIEEMKNNNNYKDEKVENSNIDNKSIKSNIKNKDEFIYKKNLYDNYKNEINNESKIKNENKANNEDKEENINKNEEEKNNNKYNKENINNKNNDLHININKNELNNIKNEKEILKNDIKFIEDDTISNITFIKDINTIDINDKNNKSIYSNDINNTNNNYHSIKGNLFNLNKKINTDLSQTIDSDNQSKNGIYFFRNLILPKKNIIHLKKNLIIY